MIYVKAYDDLRKYIHGEGIGSTVEFNNKNRNIKIMEVIKYYKIPLNKINIILLNGEYADFDTIVKNNDTIVFFSPVSGG